MQKNLNSTAITISNTHKVKSKKKNYGKVFIRDKYFPEGFPNQ